MIAVLLCAAAGVSQWIDFTYWLAPLTSSAAYTSHLHDGINKSSFDCDHGMKSILRTCDYKILTILGIANCLVLDKASFSCSDYAAYTEQLVTSRVVWEGLLAIADQTEYWMRNFLSTD